MDQPQNGIGLTEEAKIEIRKIVESAVADSVKALVSADEFHAFQERIEKFQKAVPTRREVNKAITVSRAGYVTQSQVHEIVDAEMKPITETLTSIKDGLTSIKELPTAVGQIQARMDEGFRFTREAMDKYHQDLEEVEDRQRTLELNQSAVTHAVNDLSQDIFGDVNKRDGPVSIQGQINQVMRMIAKSQELQAQDRRERQQLLEFIEGQKQREQERRARWKAVLNLATGFFSGRRGAASLGLVLGGLMSDFLRSLIGG